MSQSRLGAVLTRFVLLAVVISGTGALFGALFLPTAVAVTDVVDAVDRGVFDVPPLPDAEVAPENSFVYAADGSQLAEINYEESRLPVTLDQVPEVARNALIATEDAAFWEHNGVNHRAIVRAALSNLRAGDITQGGSTITQQLVKMAYIGIENAEQTYDRKIREALWAIELERRLPKDAILERYLNRAYYGNGVYGIGKAAERYFSKRVEDLTLAESALLAGIVRSPETNNPLKNPRAARERRDIVLDQMAVHGYVTAAQATAAKAEPLGLAPKAPEPPQEPWWVSYVTQLLTDEEVADALGTHVDALDAMGATSEERIRSVFQGGLRVYTTLDRGLQDLAVDAIRQHLSYEDEPPTELAKEPLGAIVSVEPGSGAVRAMAIGPRSYGSCSEEDGGGWAGVDDDGRLLCERTQLNPIVPGAGGSGRQPGSSFKPFLIAAALERGFPPGWQVDANGPADIPGCDNGGDWRVNNAGGNGIHDMYSGVKASSNVFHAKLVKEVGPEHVAEVAGRLGIQNGHISPECAIALGAADVFPLEMATAYATLANRGEYCPPHVITRIEDRAGRLIYEYTPRCQQAIDADIADRVVDIMAGPVSGGGTAPGANLGRWPTRGKTGTTQDYRDAWFVGYVRQLATAAWVGYPNGVQPFETVEQARARCPEQYADAEASGAPRQGAWCIEMRFLRNVTIAGDSYRRVFGGTIPAPMWATYMKQAVERFEPADYPRPGPMPTAVVPDLLAAGSIAEAEELAAAAKLHLEIEEVDHWAPEGTFVSQSPAPATRVLAGRLVFLEVSNGTGEIPTVPKLVGLPRDEAVTRLTDAGYQPQLVERETFDPAQEGRVVAQDPPPGSPLPPVEGATVTIEIGVLVEGPPPEPSPSPGAGTEPPGRRPRPGPTPPDPPRDDDGNTSAGTEDG